jgi:hypothetical protein
MPMRGTRAFEKGTILMKKNDGPKKIRLSRETLLQLNSEQLSVPRGGATIAPPCEVSSQCTASAHCSNTACGNC